MARVHFRVRCALLLFASLVLVGLTTPDPTAAQQRQDFVLSIQPSGTFILADYLFSGAALTLEHRLPIYGSSNDLTLGAATLQSYPMGQALIRADLRMLFLSLGGSLGYRAVWRNLTFEPGEDSYCQDCDRGDRRARESPFKDTPGSDQFLFAVGRAALLLPFNEHFVMASLGTMRYEGREDRSFDWFFAHVHDRGLMWRWETQAFIKHRDWGGIGPYLQLLMLPRDGELVPRWAFGFNAVTRAGLMPRNDLVFLSVLTRPTDPHYGHHSYHAPIRVFLLYRMILAL
ncbi:MAG: hypothetical protein OEZ06_18615 [Myxococcales bacterium]|nr:hypothetical protein [Myxococcales bacterium]